MRRPATTRLAVQAFIEQVLEPATSRAVLSWPVFTLASAFSVLVHLLASPEFTNQALPARSLAAAAAAGPMFLVIALAQRLPERPATRRVLLVLTSYAVGGGLRGLTLSVLLNQVEQLGASWQYRIPSSAFFMSTTTALFTYGWATYTAHLRAAARLQQETSQLQAALAHLEQASQDQAQQQLGQISTGIVRELQALEMDPVQRQIDEIQRLIDEQVRPLSRSLAIEVTRWAPSPRHAGPTRNGPMREFLQPLRHLPSPWWNLIQAGALIPTGYLLFGPEIAIRLPILVCATLIPAAWAFNALARRWLHGRGFLAQVLGITFGYHVVAAIGTASTYVALLDTSRPTFYVGAGLITEVLGAWVLIIGGALWARVVEQEQRLRLVHQDLQWAIARINLLAWFNRGVLTRLLHGPIQNAMHAAVMRLRGSDPADVVEGVIRELRLRISSVAPDAGAAGQPMTDVASALTDVTRLWAGIAEISVAVDAETAAALQADTPAAGIVIDLVQEICSNAIRHGGATRIAIQVQPGPRSVAILIIDNGKALRPSNKAGVGSQLIDTCSIDWQRGRTVGHNRLDVTIPCAS